MARCCLRLVGTEVSTECARQLNQFIEPGAIDTPIAYVGPPIRSRGRTSFPGATFDIDFYPRTGDDIGGLSGQDFVPYASSPSFFGVIPMYSVILAGVFRGIYAHTDCRRLRRFTERQLREMLLKLGAASPGLLERLDLEHLQELLMKHLGILMVSFKDNRSSLTAND